ncbi:hypothetical protein ACFP1Z_29450 [Streptomyces gamaensis]|uniref:Uncharacterized protein n=1 Tax=Streptomyces gamaensis TaxID=1763542 RepID=A0ABW0Z8M8_9ACTN
MEQLEEQRERTVVRVDKREETPRARRTVWGSKPVWGEESDPEPHIIRSID